MENIQTILVSLAAVLAMVVAAYWAYQEGYANPIIEKIGVYMFKAKAEAEKKTMQSQGMKAGEDFLDSQLKGSQQADEVKKGLGSIGGLKKQL